MNTLERADIPNAVLAIRSAELMFFCMISSSRDRRGEFCLLPADDMTDVPERMTEYYLKGIHHQSEEYEAFCHLDPSGRLEPDLVEGGCHDDILHQRQKHDRSDVEASIDVQGEQDIQDRQYAVLQLLEQYGLDLEDASGKVQGSCDEEPDIDTLYDQELRQDRRKAQQRETEQFGQNMMFSGKMVHQQVRSWKDQEQENLRQIPLE
jgi:hypothetical protein